MTKSAQTISVTKLEKELGIDREDARSIQAVMVLTVNGHLSVYEGLRYIDGILGTCGIEYIEHKNDTPHDSCGISYCDTGDMYATTVCYNYTTKTFQLKSYSELRG